MAVALAASFPATVSDAESVGHYNGVGAESGMTAEMQVFPEGSRQEMNYDVWHPRT